MFLPKLLLMKGHKGWPMLQKLLVTLFTFLHPYLSAAELTAPVRILCAAPDYLARHPPIQTPQDLTAHHCLALRENDEDVTLWRFAHAKQGKVTVRIKPVMASNDGEIIRDWALAGLGIILRSEWDVAQDLAAGRLQAILPRWSPPAADVVALLRARQGRSGRTNAFLQVLRESLAAPLWRRDFTALG